MSGTIVPASGVSNFQQQGQLDWVSLYKSTFTFSLEVMARISRAGLDITAIAVSRIICSGFVIEPAAQERVLDALSSLKPFSSYGNLIWLGFGIKPVIKDLAESEPGLACVALCACMSVSYEPFYAAQVLRELCQVRETPPDVIPSIRQWNALVNACAGSISSSKFPTLVEGLMRLAIPRRDMSLHQPTSAKALAKALGALADISRGKLANINITGGPDCLWLAAVSEWLLSLNVEIHLSSGQTVYKSSITHAGGFPHVTIIFDSGSGQQTQPILMRKCYVVPKGHKFWGSPKPEQFTLMGGRSDWTTILRDTFGSCITTLLQENLRESFALLLFDASRQAESYYSREYPGDRLPHVFSHPSSRFHFGHKFSRGQAFLEFATQRLPELAVIKETLIQFDNQSCIRPNWKDCMDRIGLGCGCRLCRVQSIIPGDYTGQSCLRLIAKTIIVFLWILSAMKVHVSLRPSSQGLQLLYIRHREETQHGDISFPAADVLRNDDILRVALGIFSGTIIETSAERSASSALSYNGICVFFGALEDLNLLPEDASTVQIIPGHIEFEGTIYQRIYDLDLTDNVGVSRDSLEPHISYKLIAQETPQPGAIAAAYQVSGSIQSYENLLGISKLAHAIAISIQPPIRCRDFCRDWNFPRHPREVLTFTPKFANLQENQNSISKKQLPCQWSLVSMPRTNADEPNDLRVVQASICTLYAKIVKDLLPPFAGNFVSYHMMDLSACLTCIVRFSLKSYRFSRHRPKDTITVTIPSQAARWLETIFEMSPERHSGSALEEAFMNDDKSFIQHLQERSAEVETKDSDGKTVLHEIATCGHEGMLLVLLQGNASVDATSKHGDTALHFAAREGHEGAVKLLLERGAKLRFKDDSGQTPLSLAAGSGHETVVKLLLEKGADLASKDNSGRTLLSWAAGNGHEAVVKLLLDEGADLDSKDENGQTPLSWAARNGCEAMMKLLFEKGADLDSKDENGRTPLSWAAGSGHVAMVKLLIENGADLDSKAGNGRTPLSWAAGNGQEMVVKLLLEKGAELEYKNIVGRTPLLSAAEGGHKTVMMLLLGKGADVNSKSNYGQTPLSLAAKNGHVAVVKLLLEKDADPDPKSLRGRTPLSLAAENGFEVVVRLLLEKGADPGSKDGSGRTPLSLAAENGHEKVLELLKSINQRNSVIPTSHTNPG
jgi:ankyrin repeat protein